MDPAPVPPAPPAPPAPTMKALENLEARVSLLESTLKDLALEVAKLKVSTTPHSLTPEKKKGGLLRDR